jgi:asparagine synthase (glutamine-hydrolysing)
MCGIVGFWQATQQSEETLTRLGDAMNGTLRHRGPDDGGQWVDCQAAIVLGHRRLAIIDLSPTGHQPMMSHCRRYVIVFNGEIYNFLELRRELEKEGLCFSSTSDTEVLVNCCAQWGVEQTLSQLNGMFSFALWDRKDRALTLARDRMGKKPVYYGWIRNAFVFGSELKALCSVPGFTRELDLSSLALFLRLGYIPAPHSIYRNIFKLPAGHHVKVLTPRETVCSKPYWSLKSAVERGQQQRFQGNLQEGADELDQILRDSVRLRMLADVPVGAFLSGGIDSSLVVAVMQAQATSGVKTFTVGFSEASHNEAHYAEEIARHLGTDHTQLYLSPVEAQDTIPSMAGVYDEPFGDPSQIPTFLVSKLARRKVTVSLSGDGGDELFGGYREYLVGTRRWKVLRRLLPLRAPLYSCVKCVNSVANRRFRKIQQLLEVTEPEALHHYHVSQWSEPWALVDAAEHRTAFTDRNLWAVGTGDTERMMYMDLVSYLPEDILTKLDRASMAISLEGRVPFLDYRLVEFACRLPLDFKIHKDEGKRILRSLLARYVPQRLFERPKMGFNVPLHQWLRGPLRAWAEDLLEPAKLQQQGIINPAPVRLAWMEHLSGKQNRAMKLWSILMFQAWHQAWM